MYRFVLAFCALLLLQSTHGLAMNSDDAGEFEIALRLLQNTLFQQVLVSETENFGIDTRTIFDDDLREFMEYVRLQMPCGYPPAGIPPLVPLRADYKDVKVLLNKTE